MAEFTHNNTKNTSINHTQLELNCSYHPKVLFKEDIDSYLRSCFTNKLAEEVRELIKIYY